MQTLLRYTIRSRNSGETIYRKGTLYFSFSLLFELLFQFSSVSIYASTFLYFWIRFYYLLSFSLVFLLSSSALLKHYYPSTTVHVQLLACLLWYLSVFNYLNRSIKMACNLSTLFCHQNYAPDKFAMHKSAIVLTCKIKAHKALYSCLGIICLSVCYVNTIWLSYGRAIPNVGSNQCDQTSILVTRLLLIVVKFVFPK